MARKSSKSASNAGPNGNRENEVGEPGEVVRRFDSKTNIKKAKRDGIQLDPDKGTGIPASSTDIDPVEPDSIKKITGARNADYYLDIDISGKQILRRTTKSGIKEIVVLEDVKPDDIVNSGRTRKSRMSPDED